MPDPIVERITQNIVESLSGVHRAAGYDNDLTVRRPNPSLGNTRVNGLCVVVQGNPTRIQEEKEDNVYVYWIQPYMVLCYVIESEGSEISIDRRLNSIRSDVEKKLMEDPRRGELAFDTKISDPDLFALPALNANAGEIVVNAEVHYRHAYANPFSQ